MEGGREGRKEGGSEGGREGRKEGGMEGGREGRREGVREGGKEAGREEGEYMMGFDNSEYEPILTHTSTHTPHAHTHTHTQTHTHTHAHTHTHLRTEKTLAILPTALTRRSHISHSYHHSIHWTLL